VGWRVGVLHPDHTSSTTTPQPTPLSPPWRGTAPYFPHNSHIKPQNCPPNTHVTAFHSPPWRGQGWVGVWACFNPNHASSNTISQPTPLSPPWRGTAPRSSRKTLINAPNPHPLSDSISPRQQTKNEEPRTRKQQIGARGGLVFQRRTKNNERKNYIHKSMLIRSGQPFTSPLMVTLCTRRGVVWERSLCRSWVKPLKSASRLTR
jgi:hypothetical protein